MYKDIINLDKDSSLLWIIVISIVSILLWASFSKLDIVSISNGNIIPSSKIKHIQHLEGGIVDEIKVEEGQSVSQNEPLLILSSISNKSDLGEIRIRILSLKADIYRLEAESNFFREIKFDKSFKKDNLNLVKRTKELFISRRDSFASKIVTQKKAIEAIEARLENSKKRLLLAKEQVQIGENLIKEKLSNRYEQVDRLKEVNILESSIDEDKVAIKKAKEQLKQIKKEYKEDVETKLSESRQSLKEFTQRAQKYEDTLKRTVIKSPMSGVIKSLNVVTIGGVVKAGDTVVEIVPLNDKLIVEAKLLPQDVGYIKKNAKAFIQLDGNDGYRYGKLNGKVVHISPDSLITDKGESFFLAKIELEKSYFGNQRDKIELFSGMIVTVGIVLGERSVLEYILSPFLESSNFVLSER
jgi:adhesin transport system membrane fusion protein